jgi:hypothetical protein
VVLSQESEHGEKPAFMCALDNPERIYIASQSILYCEQSGPLRTGWKRATWRWLRRDSCVLRYGNRQIENKAMAERVGLYPTQFVVGTRWDAFFRYRNLLHPKDLF